LINILGVMVSAPLAIAFSLAGMLTLVYALPDLRRRTREAPLVTGAGAGVACLSGLVAGTIIVHQASYVGAAAASFLVCGVGYLGAGLATFRKRRQTARVLYSCLGVFVIGLLAAAWLTDRELHQ
jgi:hypothetical protein